MVNVDLNSAIITIVSNALNTLVSREKPGFRALSKGLIVIVGWSGAQFTKYLTIYRNIIVSLS